MPFKRSVLRFAHTPGHTHCCYSEVGDRIITSGADGDIRIWNGLDDDDPTSQCIGEFVLSVAQYDKRIVASTDLNTVQAYTFPEGDRDGTEFRFVAPVTCIQVTKKYIAAGSEDTTIKVAPLGKIEEAFELNGHEGPVLRIDLNENDLLVSSGGDGTIRIWDLIAKKQIKCLPGFEKCKSFFAAKKFVSPVFEPTKGKSIAFIQDKKINIINTEDFEITMSLKNDKISSDYSICSFCPSGKYLAAGTTSGEISIWSTSSGEALKGDTIGTDCQGITAIAWNPNNYEELAYVDNTGQLGIVADCGNVVEEDVDDLLDNRSECDVDFGDVEFTNGDNDDEDDENCISLEKLKNETLKPTMRDETDDILDGRSDISEKLSTKNAIISYKPPAQQSSFQPGSTPQNLEHRYMVWNGVGIVRAHSSDNSDSIEAEFHDASIHHAIHMANYNNHTMASLSSKVFALSGETPSKLVCISLGAGSREWSITMPDCEEVLALTASDKLVAVATDARMLRIFSIMGTQREVLALPGPAVALAGHNDTILAAYHSAPASEDQHISIMLVQAIGLSLKCRDIKLPLTPATKLKWIGFSDCGSPVFSDSMGMIKMMNLKGNFWIPICDTQLHVKSESDNFFIINVSEVNQIVQAVLCRGSLYPLTNPRPMVSELPMQIPMCLIESEKTQMEEQLIRNVNFSTEHAEAKMKEVAIKLFAHACRTEMEARAKELIEMIASPILLPLAIRYASKLGRMHLSEKLEELLPQIEEQEREKEKKSNDIEAEAINLLQNSPMNASLLLNQKDKNATPIIAPKPIISSQKRNPFKRLTAGPSKPVANPLLHLSNKVMGYSESQETNLDPIPLNGETTAETQNESMCDLNIDNTENINVNEQTPSTSTVPQKSLPSFTVWFSENRNEILSEFPNMKPIELTSKAMQKYKSLSGNAVEKQVSQKRKQTDDSDTKQSGMAKLTKFGFNKIAF